VHPLAPHDFLQPTRVCRATSGANGLCAIGLNTIELSQTAPVAREALELLMRGSIDADGRGLRHVVRTSTKEGVSGAGGTSICAFGQRVCPHGFTREAPAPQLVHRYWAAVLELHREGGGVRPQPVREQPVRRPVPRGRADDRRPPLRTPPLFPVQLWTPGDVVRLQRSAGNRAVATVLQRQPKPPPKKPQTRRQRAEELRAMRARLQAIVTANEQRVVYAQTYITDGLVIADAAKTKLAETASRYKTGYDNHQRVMRRAEEQAKDQEALAGILIGIGIGVTAGMIGGAVLGAGASAGTRLLVEFVTEVGEAGGVAVAGKAIDRPTPFVGAGIDPVAMTVAQYEKIVALYRGLAETGRQALNLPLFLSRVQYLAGQVRLLEAGVKADLPLDRIQAEYTKASAIEASGLGSVHYPLGPLRELQAELQAKPIPEVRSMEQDIWVAWIASLEVEVDEETVSYHGHDVLDIDEIEDYLHGDIGVLGSGGILGVDTREVWDTDKEIQAIKRASSRWTDLYYRVYLPMLRG
jgi:hypothetical protein